jgi:histone acetyltransferase (RNA polymerase elongator complex component)
VKKVREYDANEGHEYFITYENADKTTLYGFLRLRLSASTLLLLTIVVVVVVVIVNHDCCLDAGSGVFPELKDTALIRELHVYGQVCSTQTTTTTIIIIPNNHIHEHTLNDVAY